jgi:hypothetical protein
MFFQVASAWLLLVLEMMINALRTTSMPGMYHNELNLDLNFELSTRCRLSFIGLCMVVILILTLDLESYKSKANGYFLQLKEGTAVARIG